MKCLIFAAGRGTRLKPLTDTVPKALVCVAGKPLLWHTLCRLRDAGASEVVVNVHHLGEQIIDYLSHHDFGLPVRISDERNRLLDTGGGLRQALALFSPGDDPILIHNVDILSDAPLRTFYEENRDADAALLVSPRETSRYLLFDDTMRLRAWTNTRTGEVRTPFAGIRPEALRRYAFSGIHLVAPRLLPRLQTYPDVFPIMDFYIQQAANLRIRGVAVEGLRLLDVGKQDTLAAADKFLQALNA